eukprot:11429994-Prorocentrum_lima.AAC.1
MMSAPNNPMGMSAADYHHCFWSMTCCGTTPPCLATSLHAGGQSHDVLSPASMSSIRAILTLLLLC